LDRDRPFEGIFAHLTHQCGENPDVAGLIAITTIDHQTQKPISCSSLISPETKAGPFGANASTYLTGYVKIDFKSISLIPSAYSIKPVRTAPTRATWASLYSTYPLPQESGTQRVPASTLCFEGSNDDMLWEKLDSQPKSILANNDTQHSFEISTATRFRFLRFVIHDALSNHSIWLHAIELFGLLRKCHQ
jgi:hypothetical protein